MSTPSVAGTTQNRIETLLLDSYLELNIGSICPHGYHDDSFNHCAHFVCHALGLAIGYTCKAAGSKPDRNSRGAGLRVHEVFTACPVVGEFAETRKSLLDKGCLIFVTAPQHVKLATKIMTNVPRKHIGILYDGTIWHYSNYRDKVVTATPEQFKHHYKGQTNGLFYGEVPANSAPAAFAR